MLNFVPKLIFRQNQQKQKDRSIAKIGFFVDKKSQWY